MKHGTCYTNPSKQVTILRGGKYRCKASAHGLGSQPKFRSRVEATRGPSRSCRAHIAFRGSDHMRINIMLLGFVWRSKMLVRMMAGTLDFEQCWSGSRSGFCKNICIACMDKRRLFLLNFVKKNTLTAHLFSSETRFMGK